MKTEYSEGSGLADSLPWLVNYAVGSVAFILILAGSYLRLKKPKVSEAVRLTSFALLFAYSAFLITYDFVRGSLALLTAVVGIFLSSYTSAYERAKYPNRNLTMLIDVFVLAVFLVFASENLLSFITFWLFAEIIGFFAIVFEMERRTLIAGLRYLLISMVPADVALLTVLGVSSIKLGFTEALLLPMSDLSNVLAGAEPLLLLLVLLGFMAKAAVAPFHFWLPDAHSLAPAPASAVLSGVMVKMGIYGVMVAVPAVDAPYVLYAVLIFSSLTVIYGGLQALVQTDLKRLLAYSTIENTSLITLAVVSYKAFGVDILLTAGVVYSIAHGIFKASLFMNSGTIEILTHTRELPKLGYLSKVVVRPTFTALLSTLSLIGIPPTAGFLGKVLLLAGLVSVVYVNPSAGIALVVVAALGAALAIAYGVRYMTAYWGSPTLPKEVSHVNAETESSELMLSLMNVFIAIPTYLSVALVNVQLLDLIYVIPLGLLTAMFLALMYYVYTFIKRMARETPWLGGAVA
ncbi:MAG: hypothetical protein B7O98_06915 [Zestosphaera tikiterensis]|uniref:NADH:quinone oxidoreductase/Mrp antiporter transmembrane domain-containing protein n=1 Tax=Zestosphaera tikiterensis TaxID=1973259 RepID=A0A2R7Y677_9CREN|nr:MAG: hypothetical protein B7O98_06915 [Zestosphaera tikiterensis]